MGRKSGVTLVIPCLNEERCIAPTIRWAQEVYREHSIEGEILVVDNGCDDKTAELAQELGARVVKAPRTGYGEALRVGFENAAYEYVVMCDADMSYPLNEMPRLLAPLREGADIVIGNRLRGDIQNGAMPTLNRYLGTPVLSWLIRRLHRVPVYDCNSGFRAIRKEGLERMQLQAPGMELASEMIIRSGRLRLNYKEVPIPFYRDQRGARSHLNRWRDGLRHLKVISSSYIR